jgi:Protein of unknown function (DUF2628)
LKTFTVHEQPEPTADRIDRASELKFVKDGFAWLTGFFPPLGFIASQMWLPLLAYIVFTGVIGAALYKLGVGESSLTLASFALNLYLGFEHSTLQRWMLDNAGWTTLGSVTGKSLDECERRFFENWLPSQPLIQQGPGLQSFGKTKSGEVLPPKRMPWSMPRMGT